MVDKLKSLKLKNGVRLQGRSTTPKPLNTTFNGQEAFIPKESALLFIQ